MQSAFSLRPTRFALIAAAILGLAAPGAGARQQQGQQTQKSGSQQKGGGSLSSGLGATNLHGLTDYNNCMAATNGYREKLTAEVLRRKLDPPSKHSAEERRKIEEDIQWLNGTAAGVRNLPQPDPKHPNHWLLVLTDQEQMAINGAYGKYSNDVHQWCEAQFGGMSQFADPSGRRRTPAEPFPQPPPLSALEIAAPSGPSPMETFRNCTAARQGLRWKLMADHMEAKLAATKNLSPAERKGWEEDIALVRAAAQSGATTMPASPDPKNPVRYLARLSGEEQLAVTKEYVAASQALLEKCTAASRAEQSASTGGTPPSSGQTSRATSAANSNPQTTQRNTQQQQVSGGNAGGGSLSAALGATQADYLERGGVVACFDRIKGHMAKVTADKLEAKLKMATGLTPLQHQQWTEDIAAWRAAEAAKADQPVPPDPKNPYRWQSWLTRTERQEINMEHSAYFNKVRDECNSMDHMGTGKKQP